MLIIIISRWYIRRNNSEGSVWLISDAIIEKMPWLAKLAGLKKAIAMMLVLTACTYSGYAQDWVLKKGDDHLKIYTAAAQNCANKTVKVECTVNGKFPQVLAALLDVERQKEWVFNTKSSKLLKWVSSNEVVYYSEVSVPWPCTNRDFVAHLKITQPAPNVMLITSFADPGFVPEKDGVIRIRSSSAQWTMTETGNTIKIEYVIQFDPGGIVPGWLTNMFVTKGPYETFAKLQSRMDRPEYRNAHYDFIKDNALTSKN